MKAGFDIFSEVSRLHNVKFSAIRAVMDEAAALRRAGEKVVALSAGEPNFNTPETIKQATIQAINENYTHYGSNRGYPKLREIMAEKIKKETGVSYDPESEIVFTTGGAEALNNIILGLVEEGDEVLILSPAFVSYKNLVSLCKGICVEVPLKKEHGFVPDVKELESYITDKTKLLIMNNPNNPSGAVYDKETLRKIAELAVTYNFLILSDEMYCNLVYEGEFHSICEFPQMKERAIIVNGFSKTYAMTGWRIGYLLADNRIVTHIMKVHQYSSTCSPTFIQVGMAKALEEEATEKSVTDMVTVFSECRELLIEKIEKIKGLSFVKPNGAFYMLVDVSETGLTGEEFAHELLQEYHVAVVPAISLGRADDLKYFIRISFAASKEDICEGMDKIKSYVDRLMNNK